MVICPKCNSAEIIPILYGMPTYETFEEAEKGNIKLGGCEVFGGIPDKYCKACKHEWSLDDFMAKHIKKLRYKIVENGPCCIDDMKKWVYEINADGAARYYEYCGQSRKAVVKESGKVTKKSVKELYEKIDGYIKPWADIVEVSVCDGCSYQLQVTYIDNRKRVVTGDCGGGTIDECLNAFFRNVPEFEYLFEEDEE